MSAFWISLCSLFILRHKAQCITKYVNYANGHIQGNLNDASVIYLGDEPTTDDCINSCLDLNYICDKSTSNVYIYSDSANPFTFNNADCSVQSTHSSSSSYGALAVLTPDIQAREYIIRIQLTVTSGEQGGALFKAEQSSDYNWWAFLNPDNNALHTGSYELGSNVPWWEPTSTQNTDYNIKYNLTIHIINNTFIRYLDGQTIGNTLSFDESKFSSSYAGLFTWHGSVTYHSFKLRFPNDNDKQDEQHCRAYLYDKTQQRCYGYYGSDYAAIESSFQSGQMQYDSGTVYDTCAPTMQPTIHPTTSQPTVNPTAQSTAQSTTSQPSIYPTTIEPTIVTLVPTTSQPTTNQPSVHPTTIAPTTNQPTTSEPSTSQPSTIQPTTNQPSTSQPTTSQPTTTQPTNQPTNQPSTLIPTTSNPTPAIGTPRTIIGTWLDDFEDDSPLPGWTFTDGKNLYSGIDPITNGLIKYHGPFEAISDGFNGDDLYTIQQEFYCWKRSEVSLTFYIYTCGTETSDYVRLTLDGDVYQTALAPTGGNSYSDSALGAALTVQSCSSGWKNRGPFTYTISDININTLFTVQFVSRLSTPPEAIALSGISITCNHDPFTTPAPTRVPTTTPTRVPTTTPISNNSTTNIPTTNNPTTNNPTTAMPTTNNPTTSVPTNNVPTTLIPTTIIPTTSMPTTSMPTTSIPTTNMPTTFIPTTFMPTTNRPTSANPTTSNPTNTPQPTKSPSKFGDGEVPVYETTIGTEDTLDLNELNNSGKMRFQLESWMYLVVGFVGMICILAGLIMCYIQRKKKHTKKLFDGIGRLQSISAASPSTSNVMNGFQFDNTTNKGNNIRKQTDGDINNTTNMIQQNNNLANQNKDMVVGAIANYYNSYSNNNNTNKIIPMSEQDTVQFSNGLATSLAVQDTLMDDVIGHMMTPMGPGPDIDIDDDNTPTIEMNQLTEGRNEVTGTGNDNDDNDDDILIDDVNGVITAGGPNDNDYNNYNDDDDDVVNGPMVTAGGVQNNYNDEIILGDDEIIVGDDEDDEFIATIGGPNGNILNHNNDEIDDIDNVDDDDDDIVVTAGGPNDNDYDMDIDL